MLIKMMKFPPKWLKDPDWRHVIIILPPLSLLIYLSLSLSVSPLSSTINLFSKLTHNKTSLSLFSLSPHPPPPSNEAEANRLKKMNELKRSKIAVCLVGGARRFELTGPSIMKNILKVYPNADLFLHAPLDKDSYKFSFLKASPRIASVKVFKPQPIPETDSERRVLTMANSPNGIQGLLQYFNLVQGCLTMINTYQNKFNFTYDWIVRTRVDGYWNAPLQPENFIPGKYLVPPGSMYSGLNDRLGIGDLNTSTTALSRLSLIPELDSAHLTQLNSESAFRAQLTTQGVQYLMHRLPFCIVSERKYSFPPKKYGVPVAAIGSKGPLSGTKCRPCKPVCVGACMADVMSNLYKWWSWTNWGNGSIELCDAQKDWENGWEKIFDKVAGKKLAKAREKIKRMKLRDCLGEFEELKRRTVIWEGENGEEICRLGLGTN